MKSSGIEKKCRMLMLDLEIKRKRWKILFVITTILFFFIFYYFYLIPNSKFEVPNVLTPPNISNSYIYKNLKTARGKFNSQVFSTNKDQPNTTRITSHNLGGPVWIWEGSCISSEELYKFNTLKGSVKANIEWIPPRSSCWNPKIQQCFRGIWDSTIKPEIMNAFLSNKGDTLFLEALSHLLEEEFSFRSSSLKIVRKETKELTANSLFGISQLPVYKTLNWSGLHVDYFDNPDHFVSGIVFLNDHGFEGGEIGFADTLYAENGRIYVTDGLVVESKLFRMLLYTSGAENFVSNLPMDSLSDGKRTTFHFSVTCD